MRVRCRQFSGRPLTNSLYPDIFLNTPDARGRVVSAHRIVLASLSSTARRMLEEGRVRPRDVMTLRIPSFEDLTRLVKFVYTGSLELKDKDSLEALRTGLQLLGVVGTFKGAVQDILTYVVEPRQLEMARVQRTGVLEEEEVIDVLAIENTTMEGRKPNPSVVTHIFNTPSRKRKKSLEEFHQGKAPPESSPHLKKIKANSQRVGEDYSTKKVLPLPASLPKPPIIPMPRPRPRPRSLTLGRTLARPLLESSRLALEGGGEEEGVSLQNYLDSVRLDHVGIPLTESTQHTAPLADPEKLVEAKLNLKVSPEPKVKLKKVTPKKVTPKRVTPKRVTPKRVTPKKVTPKNITQKKPTNLEMSSDAKKSDTNSPASEYLPLQGSPAVFKPALGEAVMLSSFKTDYVQVQCKLCTATPRMTSMRQHVRTKHGITIGQYKTEHGEFLEPIQRIYHTCGLCGDLVLLDMDEIAKHIKREHRDTTHKDYNERFLFEAPSQPTASSR